MRLAVARHEIRADARDRRLVRAGDRGELSPAVGDGLPFARNSAFAISLNDADIIAPMRILAISGSLRNGSSNTNLLLAAAQLVPAGVEMTLYTGLGDLPPFNPDVESAGTPIAAVDDFRAQFAAADAVAICSPEYAHGVPGVLKNALDWWSAAESSSTNRSR